MKVVDHSEHRFDRLFQTDHLEPDLRGNAVRGGATVLVAQAAKFLLQLTSTVILARLLRPSDFGLVAMVAAFIGFISLFKDLGLATATIQQKNINHAQVSTMFWINVGLSVALMAVSMALAPLVSRIYDEPRLTAIMLVVAASFVLGGLATQHLALLRRQMRFAALSVIDIVSQCAGVFAALLVVWAGGGYWALVAMTPATALFTLGMAWRMTGWRPGRPRRGVGIRSILKFGGNLTSFNVTNYFSRNADGALIGWAWGPMSLGLYNRAYSLLMLPLNQINAPLSGVTISTLSRSQGNSEEYRQIYCRIANLIVYATVPMLAILAVMSEPLIAVTLGPQWSEASAILSVLAIAAIGQPLLWTAAWVHVSLGRTHRLRNWGLVTDPLCVLAFVVGLPWGAMGVATAYAVYVNAIVIPGMFYALNGTPVGMRDLLKAVWCPFLSAAAVFGGAWLGRNMISLESNDWSAIAFICLGAIAGALAFAGSVPQCRRELLSFGALFKYLRFVRSVPV
jgi:O-antigen/teichoic acid export membrane protein